MGGNGTTEFARVVERLDIALTPQAKGRVERANQTLQDRLIKEMRLRNIHSMARVDALVVARRLAGSIVSGRGGGIKPGACGAPLRGFGA